MGGWLLIMAHQGGGVGFVSGTLLILVGVSAHGDTVSRSAYADRVTMSVGVLLEDEIDGGQA